jgi:5-methylcytosine-specific restriction endonuclease McrA
MDSFKRIQTGLKLQDLYPAKRGVCACGCGIQLKGKQKKWASTECCANAYNEFAVIKGNTGIIRKILFDLEGGYCRMCGAFDEKWQADHILPVHDGGGACDISNYQTLCLDCHVKKHNIKYYPNVELFLRTMPLMLKSCA